MARMVAPNLEETIMLRKFSLAAVAAAALGVAALAPTSASAWGHGWHHGGWHHHHAEPPCPYVYTWHLPRKAYADWVDFNLFRGSWKERHRVVRRDRRGVVVKVVRPAARYGCV